MLDFKQKRKFRAILYHRATLVLLFLAVLIILNSTWTLWRKKIASEDLKNISLNRKIEMEKRSIELENQIRKLETESGMEAEIRSKFSVAKDGENMALVVDKVEQPKATTTEGFWQKILNLFKK